MRLLEVRASRTSPLVPVRYELVDSEGDFVRIEVAFSTDDGASYAPATEASGAGSEGTLGLAASATIEHFEIAKPSLHDIFVRIARPNEAEMAVAAEGPA